MNKIFCDRCGKETKEASFIKIGGIDKVDFFGNQSYIIGEHFDLCTDCLEECRLYISKKD